MPTGKNKGNAFERKMAKYLSKWWTDNRDDSVFWRSASSGAWATHLKLKGINVKEQSGDLSVVQDIECAFIKEFYIELKHYKKFELRKLLQTQKDTLYKFWVTTCEEAESFSQYPLLIFKTNHIPEMVIYNYPNPLNIDCEHFLFRNPLTHEGTVCLLDCFLDALKKYYIENNLWDT